MVNPEVDYVKIKLDGEKECWIIAEVLAGIFMNSVIGKKFKIVEKFKGEKLEGQEYEHFLEEEMPVYSKLKKKSPNLHTILLSKQYVNTLGGTGLVHCAPGCGPEDEEVGREYGIEGYNSLDERGMFTEGKFKGWRAKTDDNKFLEYFKQKGNLIATTRVEHEYPHSWRSHEPVIFRTTEQWFLKISDLVDKLLRFNKKVHWVPKKAGESYDRWAENLRDNSVTRQRFWGCPVPIWVNREDEKDYIVIGSVEELEKLTGKKFNDLSLHKPWIDKIIIKKDGREYERIPDVSDVWIDSGTAGWNCLYDDEKLIKEWFPADLVLEGTEHTRLWFSLLQICSAIVFNKSCFDNVYAHGMIFDFQGVKMSKSLGNIISPYEVVDKYSSDIFRYYMCEMTAGENINFNWEDVKQKQRNLLILMNIANYIKDLIRQGGKGQKKIPLDVEERYILSKANSTINKVSAYLENYQLDDSIGEIERLFLDLSRVYIKITRDKANDNGTRGLVLQVVSDVYIKCLKMFSIVCPLVTEQLWQDLRKVMNLEESVHLTNWPKYDSKLVNEKLESEFEVALEVIEKGLAERDKAQIGLKWPLAKASVKTSKKISKELKEIIMGQLNIKGLGVKPGKETSVKLDTKLTKELEAEGYAREISRKVQAARKKAGFVKTDQIKLALKLDKNIEKLVENQIDFIKERTNASSVELGIEGKHDHEFDDKLKSKQVRVCFSKV
jgi:isoleucyl-tRNA synthetase